MTGEKRCEWLGRSDPAPARGGSSKGGCSILDSVSGPSLGWIPDGSRNYGGEEGGVALCNHEGLVQRGFAPTVYQLLERYALEGEAGLAKCPADDRHAPAVSATLIGMLGLRAVNGRSGE